MLLVQRGLAPSREKAKAMIMEGNVYVNGQKEDKAGAGFDTEVPIEVRGNTLAYVSRGGLKLEKAMKEFALSLDGMVCMDIGASTGGFTGRMHGKDEYPLCHTGGYRGAVGFCVGGCIVYLAHKGARTCKGAVKGKRRDGMPDQAAV